MCAVDYLQDCRSGVRSFRNLIYPGFLLVAPVSGCSTSQQIIFVAGKIALVSTVDCFNRLWCGTLPTFV